MICSRMVMCTLTSRQIFMSKESGEGSRGDACLLARMYSAGMRGVRINTAHLSGTEELEEMACLLKTSFPDLQVLVDTKGPEVRTTAVADGALLLSEGDRISVLGTTTDLPSTHHAIYVNYPQIHTEVRPGDILLADDARISMIVEEVDGGTIHVRVCRGGELGSHKGLAVEGVDLSLPAVSERDKMFISCAAASPYVDVIAHSFVRSAADVQAVKEAMAPKRKPVVAKIENRQGIDNLARILSEADGVLIARGDLTASIGAEAVCAAQALIAAAAKDACKPLYLATNILPSLMHGNAVSQEDLDGIALAMQQGVDVMLLTNETASGAHPLESVATLAAAMGLGRPGGATAG